MAVDIRIKVKGSAESVFFPNQESYSVVENSTPLDPSDSSGGVGQLTLVTQMKDGYKNFLDANLVLTDKANGTTEAVVKTIVSNQSKQLTITADSRLSQMIATRTAQPYQGTLEGALLYYLGLVGLTSDIVVDATIKDNPVTLMGWEGEVWFQVAKKMAPALGFEISLVGTTIVFRPPRGRTAVDYRDSSVSFAADRTQTARNIRVWYYNLDPRVNGLAYPPDGWENASIFDVAANETKVFDEPINASLSAVQQPVAVDLVTPEYSGSSVYTIVGSDNLPVTAAQWNATGGSVSVEIGSDTSSLKISVTGAFDQKFSPYRIAMSSGANNDYSSLRIVGTGVFSKRTELVMPTGLDVSQASEEFAPDIDNPFISTIGDAYDAGWAALPRWIGPKRILTVGTKGINRVGDSGSYAYPTIGEFNAEYAGLTIAQMNTLWAGKTIREFNDFWLARAAKAFANQAFGNLSGARRLWEWAWYRIREATSSFTGATYTAEADTTIADFNAVWGGKTIKDFNEAWYARSISEANMEPLRYRS